MILDVTGLAARIGLTAGAVEAVSRQETVETGDGEGHSLLLFENAPGEACAIPTQQIARLEPIRASQIEHLGGRRTMQYCGGSLPVVALHDAAAVSELNPEQQRVVIVFREYGPTGLAFWRLNRWTWWKPLTIDTVTCGSEALSDRRCSKTMNIFELTAVARSELTGQPAACLTPEEAGEFPAVAAGDSEFRGQIQGLAEAVSGRVPVARKSDMGKPGIRKKKDS